VKANTGMKAMNDSSKVDLTDEMNVTYDVSDEALEIAAGSARERGGRLHSHSAPAWTPARVKLCRL
jgi:hypothetical protein